MASTHFYLLDIDVFIYLYVQVYTEIHGFTGCKSWWKIEHIIMVWMGNIL